MNSAYDASAATLFLIGCLLLLAVGLKGLLGRTRIPPVVGYLMLGMALPVILPNNTPLTESTGDVLSFLANVGIACLLFRVGLESDLVSLIASLRAATWVWLADVGVSGAMGFFGAHYLFALDLVPSLFVATAFTATSVGVSIAVWRDRDAVDTPTGRLLIDVAELDDISGVLLMAILLGAAPLLLSAETTSPSSGALAADIGRLLLKLALFLIGAALFARFAEERLTRLFTWLEPVPDRLISVASTGFLIAAIASALGLSLAIGAFFGGLCFSRDPEAVRLDASFDSLYDFFTPFFFIHIGAAARPELMSSALPLTLGLFALAAGGKLLGAGGGAIAFLGWRRATLLGLSMVPRAEIALLIMARGAGLGERVVPPELFSAVLGVSLLGCVLSPIAVDWQLRRAH